MMVCGGRRKYGVKRGRGGGEGETAEVERKRWDIMVLLTGMSIIEEAGRKWAY